MTIYSIGYQAITVKELLRIMNEKGIERVIDVRSFPYSRIPEKYEFNRNRMEELLGFRYIWKGDILGGKRGPVKAPGIRWLTEFMKGRGDSVILMCMESHPCDCHRYQEIGLKLQKLGVEVIHLFRGGIAGTACGLAALDTSALKEVCLEKQKKKG